MREWQAQLQSTSTPLDDEVVAAAIEEAQREHARWAPAGEADAQPARETAAAELREIFERLRETVGTNNFSSSRFSSPIYKKI